MWKSKGIKKWLCLLAIALAAGTLATACGTGAKSEDKPSGKAPLIKVGAEEKKDLEKKTRADFAGAKGEKLKVELIDIEDIDKVEMPESTKSTLSLGIEEARAKYKQLIVARITRGKDDPVYVIWRKNPDSVWKPTD